MKLCYLQERHKWSEAYKLSINEEQSRLVFKKLIRHFKTHTPQIDFSNRRGGCAVFNKTMPGYVHTIKIGYTPFLGTVIHEFAHLLANHQYNKNCKHTKKFMRTVDKVHKYVKNRNYFKFNSQCKNAKSNIDPEVESNTSKEGLSTAYKCAVIQPPAPNKEGGKDDLSKL